MSNQLQVASLTQLFQSYVSIDNEIQSLQAQQKSLRETKQNIQKQIIDTMKQNNIDHRTVKSGNHQFHINKRKQQSALSFGYIQTCFDELIPDEEQRNYVLQYLKEHREIKLIDELKMNPL